MPDQVSSAILVRYTQLWSHKFFLPCFDPSSATHIHARDVIARVKAAQLKTGKVIAMA
jgi:hypothetical protein